jgi:hypothetical protein
VAEAARASGEADLFGPNEAPVGVTWEDWAARYDKWFQEIPFNKNPAVHPESRRNCEVVSDVTMVGPSGTADGCQVEAGRPVLLSPLGYGCSTAEGDGRTYGELRRCVKRNFKTQLGDAKLKLYVDGTLVTDPDRWIFVSSEGKITFPDKNIFGAPGGRTRSMGKGFYFMLRSPTPGQHVVQAKFKLGGKSLVVDYPFTAV